MKLSLYQCDKCAKRSNGDLESWWVMLLTGQEIHISQLIPDPNTSPLCNTYCGMECAISAVSEAMRTLAEREGK